MSSKPMIEAQGLAKAFQLYAHQNDQLKQILFGSWQRFYREKWVLNDVNFQISKGECVGLIGRNGAGKTTLLQILCGITAPTRGQFHIAGRIAPILALGSAFDGLLTGRENARIGAAILGLSRREVDACIEDIKAFADIGPAFEEPMRTYSSGMIARVAFAICVYVDADVLIVDEALSVGDAIFQKKCEVYISHALEFICEQCNRVVWLENGVVKLDGDPHEVVAAYREAMADEGERAST